MPVNFVEKCLLTAQRLQAADGRQLPVYELTFTIRTAPDAPPAQLEPLRLDVAMARQLIQSLSEALVQHQLQQPKSVN